MQATSGVAPETKAEAAAWLVRLHADNRSEADERAFRLWIAAKPENARAFEAVTTLWDTADGLRAVMSKPARGRFPLRRRTLLAGGAALAAASAAFAVWDVAYAGVFETDVGEQKHVTLSDGTEAFLDTDTRIRERYSAALRIVELERGRADFRVKPDSHRPFVVEALEHRILADRTTLDVRRDGSRVSIVLLQGQATVLAKPQAAAQRVILTRGERAILAPDIVLHIDRPNLTPLIAWQSGQAIFESNTLAAAVAEMNRYSTVRLVADDPLVARMKLSGVYRVGDNEAFAHSVSQLLPVTIERYPDHIAFVRDESRTPEG
ncbi:MAG TPA: FecR domain-containing protein [Rhizomicrobium sp.]|nr:FecR domain-containing protein [Rhizomicrobium sp.]